MTKSVDELGVESADSERVGCGDVEVTYAKEVERALKMQKELMRCVKALAPEKDSPLYGGNEYGVNAVAWAGMQYLSATYELRDFLLNFQGRLVLAQVAAHRSSFPFLDILDGLIGESAFKTLWDEWSLRCETTKTTTTWVLWR